MKEMIKRVREEKGGFTLAELLIVVAIIVVLVAIAVPVFTANLDQAKQAAESANISNVKTAATAVYSDAEIKKTGDGEAAVTGTWYVDANKNVVKLKQGDSVPADKVAGPYTVSVVPGASIADTQINVAPAS